MRPPCTVSMLTRWEWWVTYSPWCVHTIETEALADPSVQHLRQSLARLYLGRRPVIRLTRPDPTQGAYPKSSLRQEHNAVHGLRATTSISALRPKSQG